MVEGNERTTAEVGIDRALTRVEKQVDLLLNITPTNVAEAWQDFERSSFGRAPTLHPRPLRFDPDLLKRELFDLRVETIEEQALAQLLKQKRDELVRQIMLLEDRDTSRFMHGSVQIFGEASSALVTEARKILANVDPGAGGEAHVTAESFLKRAEEEIAEYRHSFGGFQKSPAIRDDIADLMVSHGQLFIGATTAVRESRLEALIHHEVGTHIVTYENGMDQPLEMFALGLPGYEETQEGLAVLAEYIVGGLDPQRVRVLAARVIAVSHLLDGADFIEIFRELHDGHDFPAGVAWAVTVRVARSGGLTKDVIYLRGLTGLLEFLSKKKQLDPLLAGKMALDHVPLVEDLLRRGVLKPPRVRPRWLDVTGADARLDDIFKGSDVLDLLGRGP